MKKNILLAVFALCIQSAFAQFSFDQDVMILPNPDPATFELILDNHITNTSGGPLALRWTRITNDLAAPVNGSTLGSSVCIRDLCYSQNTSSKTFNLDPNERAILAAHLWNTANHPDPSGIVAVKVELENDPNVSKVVTFIFDESLDADVNLQTASVKLFPNPSTEFVALEGAEWATTMRIVDMQGRQLADYPVVEGQKYAISNFPTGVLIAILYDNKGVAQKAIRFEKQ